MKKFIVALAASGLLLTSAMKASDVESAVYGKLPDGREAKIFTLTNTKGMTAKVTEYGAILASVVVPDKNGVKADVTLGFDKLEGWLHNPAFFGSTVGRFGNRIAHGKFTLDGKEYTLATNNHPGDIPCHLHGGVKGYNQVLWSGKPVKTAGAAGVELTYVSKDGEEGYPGTLTVHVTYLLNESNELTWEVSATTDKPTILNLAQHTYWNLGGDGNKTILDDTVMLNADKFLPTDKGLIPTGVEAPVAGTPMDFTKPTTVGASINADYEALKLAGGYDHCWVVRGESGMRPVAVVKNLATGRTLELSADQPGVQFYSGNFLDGSVKGKNGIAYQKNAGLCLETEGFPDAPNHPNFPSAVLRPGQTYHHKMLFKFTN